MLPLGNLPKILTKEVEIGIDSLGKDILFLGKVPKFLDAQKRAQCVYLFQLLEVLAETVLWLSQ